MPSGALFGQIISRRDVKIYTAASILIVVIGAYLTRNSIALPSIDWMNIYRVEDTHDLGEVLEFFENLRVPIPIPTSLLEIATHFVSPSAQFVEKTIYRWSIIAAYWLALVLCYPSISRLAVVFPISILFLWSTTIIHPGNPQVYDVVFPLFLLISLVLLKIVDPVRRASTTSMVVALGAGLFLSLAELTRPFFIFLMPVIIVMGYVRLRQISNRHVLIFVAPIILLSGTWHLYQFARYGQLTWSNHSGFNLNNAWPMVDYPDLAAENSPPIKPGRWQNLNTSVHGENSRLLQSAVVQYVVANPIESGAHVINRITLYASAPTSIYSHTPDHLILEIYRPAVLVAITISGVGSALLVLSLIGYRGKITKLAAAPENALIVLTFMSVLILSVGEIREEARFLIAILPFLALMQPTQHTLAQIDREARWRYIPHALCFVGIGLVLFGPFMDLLRSGSIDFGVRQFIATVGGAYLIAVGILEMLKKFSVTNPESPLRTSGRLG